MSRFLTAFRLSEHPADEKRDFSGAYIPNKSEKANNPSPAIPGGKLSNQNNPKMGFSGFSDYSGLYDRKNAFFDNSPEPASDTALEATERAAIIAEGEHSNATAPVPHKLPPSWADASINPTAGARCHCCKGSRWWCEAVNPSGWRCAGCHPPDHLQAGQFRVVAT